MDLEKILEQINDAKANLAFAYDDLDSLFTEEVPSDCPKEIEGAIHEVEIAHGAMESILKALKALRDGKDIEN